MKSIACKISYGNTKINYELLRMNRKSLEIAVHPDKSVVVKAPVAIDMKVIEDRVHKRARWIKRQIAYFNQFDPRTPERRHVGGESHLYLGRKYRLKIRETGRDKILLKGAYFYIECVSNRPSHIKNLLDIWYKERAETHFTRVFDECWEGFKKDKLKKPKLEMRRMNKRWGSLSARGRLTLNLNLIQAPKECIEYVVIHELCHLIHHNHSSEFYRFFSHAMPDWIKRKHKLEMSLA